MTYAAPRYAAADWGTSSFRLWLMDGNDRVVGERRSGEGMTTASRSGFAEVLSAHLKALSAPSSLPVVICGMAGARQGWVEAGYIEVPASLPAVLDGAVRVPGESRDIRILPGLAQRLISSPDVMRGEETQLIGSIDLSQAGEQMVCMPGTHSKWVRVSDGRVAAFSTFMTGELFDVLSKHSVLAHSLGEAAVFEGENPVFRAAVRAAFKTPEMVTSLMFAARSGALLHDLSPADAAARLSGTLIGAEIAGGISALAQRPAVRLVASGKLAGLYRGAFDALSIQHQGIDADDAVRRGLSAAARHIFFDQGTRR